MKRTVLRYIGIFFVLSNSLNAANYYSCQSGYWGSL